MGTNKFPIKRRDLLGGGAIAMGALFTGAAEAEPGPSTEAWDYEADVLCVGSGAAACSAAITAATHGASVIVIEKLPLAGGTTSKSGGVLWIPNNSLLRAKGVEDKRDDCLRYMARMSFPANYDPNAPHLGLAAEDYQLLATYYDTGSRMVDHMIAAGALDLETFNLYHLNIPAPDYGDYLAENKVPAGRGLQPKNVSMETGGRNLAKALEAWLRSRKIPILTDHRVTRIIMKDDRAIGVEAVAEKRVVRLKAHKGVVFGTGGYANNAKLVERHQVALYGTCAMSGSTGDFISLAGKVGAQMGPLHTAWRSQILVEEALQNRSMAATVPFLIGDSMLVVSKYGLRVLNEKQDYNERTKAHFIYDNVKREYPNDLLFLVFDHRCLKEFGGIYPIPADIRETKLIIQGATLPDLAKNIQKRLESLSAKIGGVKLAPDFSDQLAGTVKRFNGYAASGNDLEFGRGQHEYDRSWNLLTSSLDGKTARITDGARKTTMHALSNSGPYYAFILAAGGLDTSGGPAINQNAQILHSSGDVIPGLYGAGNCIATPAHDTYYAAGTTIGLAMTYGYIAGLHAATNVEV